MFLFFDNNVIRKALYQYIVLLLLAILLWRYLLWRYLFIRNVIFLQLWICYEFCNFSENISFKFSWHHIRCPDVLIWSACFRIAKSKCSIQKSFHYVINTNDGIPPCLCIPHIFSCMKQLKMYVTFKSYLWSKLLCNMRSHI